MGPGGDHLYTTSAAERDNALANLDYVDEGVACWTPVVLQGVGRTGFFRLFSPAGGRPLLYDLGCGARQRGRQPRLPQRGNRR